MKNRFTTYVNTLRIIDNNLSMQISSSTAPPSKLASNEEPTFDKDALAKLNKEKNLGLSDGAINLIYSNSGKVELTEQQIMTEAEKLYETDSYGGGQYANSKLFNNLDKLNGREGEISFNEKQKNLAWTSSAGESTVLPSDETVSSSPLISDSSDITRQGKELGESLERNLLKPALEAGADILQQRLIVQNSKGELQETDVKIYELDTVAQDLKENGRISTAFDYGSFLKTMKNTMSTPELIKTRTDLDGNTLPKAIMDLENKDGMSITATLTNESNNLTMYLFEADGGKIQAYDKDGNQLDREQFEGFPTNRFLDPSVFQGPESTTANETTEVPPSPSTVSQEQITFIDPGLGPVA